MTFYRLLLRLLLPGRFRREWGDAMADEARLQMDEARRLGSGATLRTAGRLGLDALRAGVREWWAVIRSSSGGGVMGGWAQDLRHGARGLRRAPAYTLAAVATLAVAVGVNAVVFALVDSVLLKALPYHEPERLVSLWGRENWSVRMVDLAREELRSVDAVAGYGGLLLTLSEGGEPTEIFAAHVTTNLHEILGVRPLLGRGLVAADAEPGAPPVALLSYRVWSERFGADPGILGRSVALGGEGAARRTVVGVMPAGYEALNGRGVDAWVPVTVDPTADSYGSSYFMEALGRLAPGATVDEADTDVRRWAATYRERDPGWLSEEDVARADAVSLADALVADRRTPLLLALAAVALVLLVACANVANLVLARTASRERELSVRAALGSGRARTVRLILAETALVGVAGGITGLGLALGLRAGLIRYLPSLFPPEGLPLGVRPIVATLAVAVGAAALAGLVPALGVARRDPAGALSASRGASQDRGTLRLQGALVAAQLALATVLVASAGLLGRSLQQLARVDPGFRTADALTFRISAPPAAYPTDADVVRFFQEAQAALAAVPGVESVGFVSRLPMGGGTSRITLNPADRERPPGEPAPQVDHRLVTPGYLETLGARLRAGRMITPDDDRPGDVVVGVLNQTAARQLWPDGDAVGKVFNGPGGVPWLRVVGVVEDVLESGVDRPPFPALYILHRDWPWRTMHAVVRTRGEPGERLDALKAAVWSVSASVPVSRVRTLADVVEGSFARTRLLALLAAILGGVALVLGLLGVYGVVAYATGRRRAEFGVRVALGAGRARLQRTEVLRVGRVLALGIAVGTAGAWLAGRSLGSLLFGVTPLAPGVLVPVALALGGVGLLAAWLPVRRATAVDPVEALRPD